LQLYQDSLQLLPGSELFGDMRITAMVSAGNGDILISTLNNGLYLYDGYEFRKLNSNALDLLTGYQIRDMRVLPSGLLVAGTSRGAAILDIKGEILQFVNKESGLIDELVISVFADREGGIWLALNDGLSRVEMPSPVTRFQDTSGIESFVTSVIRHNGRFYAATSRGVSYLDENALPNAKFKPVENLHTLSWSFLSAGGRLLAGTQDAVFEISDTIATRINNLSAIRLYQSGIDSNLVFAGLLEGLAVMRRTEDSWITYGRVLGISERIISIAEDDEGVWLGTQSEGLLRTGPVSGFGQSVITWPEDGIPDHFMEGRIARYGVDHGLPAGSVSPVRVGTNLVFLTTEGLRKFDKSLQQFVPEPAFGEMFADPMCWINHIHMDAKGNVWIVAGTGDTNYFGRAVPQQDGGYIWEGTPFLRINDLGRGYFTYADDHDVIWFGGAEGLARFTPGITKDYMQPFSTLIRRVSDIVNDSVLYHGSPVASMNPPRIDFAGNSLRFDYAALSYDDPASNLFQVKLEGYDAGWSAWTSSTSKDYTGLPAGSYTFHVRSRNIYGTMGGGGVYSFVILHPWYQQAWAIALYVLLAAFLVFGIVKFRVRQLERKTAELESVITERTRIIVDQTEKLKELDKMKSRFYANISHEFRTPLTLILGPLEERISKAKKKEDRDEFGMMYRSARRLLRLITELLDLSRLESDKMPLKVEKGDLNSFLRGIFMSYESLAGQKNIRLNFESYILEENIEVNRGDNFPEVWFDPEKIEKIFTNLISNAVKFTPSGGVIRCILKLHVDSQKVGNENPDDQNSYATPFADICVEDTGIGIPADRLPHIFDRFYQVENARYRDQEGTGIGLALVKELVSLHHGIIRAESTEGEGTTFTVQLPLHRANYSSEEIKEGPDPSINGADSIEKTGIDIPGELYQMGEINGKIKVKVSEHVPEEIILIVDDQPDIRSYLRKNLITDFQIFEAENGLQGLATAAEVIPDLIISDVMMPEMDGFQFCAAIKSDEKTSHIPVILLTAKAGEENLVSGLETGADNYLTKPFSKKELYARIRNLIGQRRQMRQKFVREGILQTRNGETASPDELFMHKMMNIIEENLADEKFGVEMLAERLHSGTRQLQRKVRALSGRSPVELIRSVRLHRAKHLIEEKAGTISEISMRVGYNNLSHFARIFREEFGKLPSEMH
jgi:signal transduction histidine kinase/DNA-binding response OmpR family regulator/ligand-binding sensor domain-containing protein